MKNTIVIIVIILFWALAGSAPAQQSRPLPIYPQAQTSRADSFDTDRAHQLYELLRRENLRLGWDGCLATKAMLRARRMVKRGYFDHEDPQTGTNPVWASVSQCVPANRRRTRVPAGENLAKGKDTPANIHRALMQSPTHRKNIVDPRFNRVGVGCYDYICVELFVGL
ncbi:MAG: CAP domain-containing protein [Syntrophobacteraceae bacterium]